MQSFVIPTNLPVFMLAALILLLTPGPAVLYIVTRSVDQGRKAGLASVFGVELGNSVHVLAATLGLSALLLTSALAFNIVKYAGAAYLIFIGVRTLMRPVVTDVRVNQSRKSLRQMFSQGFVVATLNPKTALFFLAFLPQFVDGTKGSVSMQFLMLGLIFVAMGFTTDSIYALLSGKAGRFLKRSIWFLRFQRFVAGTIYISLGLTAAFAGGDRK
jgi:threonine/homoserine/homoserine lactone efflux protein